MGKNWGLHHICLVVKDLDKAVKYYQSLGIVTKTKPVSEHPSLNFQFVYISGTPIEFVQPLQENSFKKLLHDRGEGMHHLCFEVDDLAKETAKLEKKGVKVLGKNEIETNFDTREVGNCILEVIRHDQ
jgi:methylmalonyl-CoA epimerase